MTKQSLLATTFSIFQTFFFFNPTSSASLAMQPHSTVLTPFIQQDLLPFVTSKKEKGKEKKGFSVEFVVR